MKTRVKTPAILLMVAIAGTLVAGNLFGSARTTPLLVEGDPIPGVDVSIEQNGGGIIIAKALTDAKGTATLTNVPPGEIRVHVTDKRPPASNNYNSAKSNTAGVMIGDREVGTIIFSRDKPGKLLLVVPRGAPLTVKVITKEGKEPRSTIKPNPSN